MKLSVIVPLPDARGPTVLLDALAVQTVSAADFEVVVVDAHSRAGGTRPYATRSPARRLA